MNSSLFTFHSSLLRPLSWLYGLGVAVRNALFNVGLLKSQSFDIPVISVGNITVGGTGKTPHVEYLLRLLKGRFRVAVLSRGYKRKTSGFILADDNATAQTIGDEPLQMKRKFPDVAVAVDKNRRRGITLLSDNSVAEDIDVVLLDDAFQHRYVKPGINILLVDYNRLIIYDKLLPAGRLREPLSGKNRADVVIVTKCPKELKPMDFRVITKQMDLYPYQHLYFTTLHYSPLRPLYGGGEEVALENIGKGTNVLLLTGIASPRQMVSDLQPYVGRMEQLAFGDHHAFTPRDVEHINSLFASLPEPRLLITTEKDAARLSDIDGLSEEVRRSAYVLPVEIRFLLGQGEAFDQSIVGYVLKNSRNSILSKSKEETKATKPAPAKPHTISFRTR